MSINERFAELLKYKNISVKDASNMLSKSEMYIRKLMRKGESFGIEPIMAILNSINDVSADWLLTGEGPMLKTDTKKEKQGGTPGLNMESIIESIITGDPDEGKEAVDMQELSSIFDTKTDPALQRLFVRIMAGYSNKLRQIRELKEDVNRLSRRIDELEDQQKQQ